MLQTLIAADPIDEHRLWVFPVVLGEGKRLFETGVPPHGFTLVEAKHAFRQALSDEGFGVE